MIPVRRRWIAAAALAALLIPLSGSIDETLDPRARALFLPEPGPLPSDNGFAYMMGFDAAPERDPRAAGAEWVSGLHKAGLDRAVLFACTVPNDAAMYEAVAEARRLNPRVRIIARCRYVSSGIEATSPATTACALSHSSS